jgi:hypothetical protein
VSKADRRAEQTLRTELTKARPAFGLLMEETGAVAGSDTSNRWIVDPLDGTTNFLHGIPHFAISIALERDGEPFAGVIYSPIQDEMYAAERGSGAFLNGRRLRVSGRRRLEESLFATGIPFLGLADHVAAERHLVECFSVHERIAVAHAAEILVRPLVEAHPLDALRRAEPLVQFGSVANVLQLDLQVLQLAEVADQPLRRLQGGHGHHVEERRAELHR